MSMQCICQVCENGMRASQRLAGLLPKVKTVARNFDNTEQAEHFGLQLGKQLAAKGVEINEWQKYGHHLFSIYSRQQNPKPKILAALSKLEYTPWIRNKQVMVHNKIGWPILVTDSEMVLLGQSVPRWARILEALGPSVKSKPMFTYQKPLGYLKFSMPLAEAQSTFSKTLKAIGFVKESEGLLLSKEDDLELSYTKTETEMHCTLQQPKSELVLEQSRFDSPGRKIGAPVAPKVQPVLPELPTPTYQHPESPEQPKTPEPPVQPSVILTQPDETILKKDNSQVPHVGIPTNLAAQYSALSYGNKSQLQLVWMTSLWKFLNQHKFESKLRLPNISFIKNIARMRTRGYWRAHTRELKIAPRLFNAPLPIFVEIFLHEMCHEAVSEVDQTVDRTQGGHGPHWQRWMRTVGLNPSRYDHNDSDVYLSEEEQIEVKKQRDVAEQNKKELALVPEWNLMQGNVVRVALEKGSVIKTGVIAGKMSGNKYIVIVDPTSGQFWKMPPQLIYKAAPDLDKEQFKTAQWLNMIDRVQAHFQIKKELRDMKKQSRYGY